MYKKFLSLSLVFSLSFASLVGCADDEEQPRQKTTTTTTTTTTTNGNRTTTTTTKAVSQGGVADGLDLSRLSYLVKRAKNAEDLEHQINESGINNVDIDGDNEVDYINVEEYREGRDRGFDIYTYDANDQRHDLATISITKDGRNADMIVQGNQQYYGSNSYYRTSFPWTQVLLAGWLFNMSRPRYHHNPYYRGHYPSYYRSTRRVPRNKYNSRIKTYKTIKRSANIPTSRRRVTRLNKSTSKSGFSKPKSLKDVKGNSFSTTSKKRPAGSAKNSNSSFGSSSNRKKTFGSSNTRTQPKKSFGSSSSRSRPKKSFGNSSTRTRPKKSFGSSSSRSRPKKSFGSSSSRKRRR